MKKLEEVLNLPPMEKNFQEQEDDSSETSLAELENSLVTVEEKVEAALTAVSELNEHDSEMDRIAREAMESYEEFKQFGMNSSDVHAAKILDSATAMLKTALEARNSKAERRMKTLDLQMKKMRLDLQKAKEAGGGRDVSQGGSFNREDLLKMLANPTEDSSDSDK